MKTLIMTLTLSLMSLPAVAQLAISSQIGNISQSYGTTTTTTTTGSSTYSNLTSYVSSRSPMTSSDYTAVTVDGKTVGINLATTTSTSSTCNPSCL